MALRQMLGVAFLVFYAITATAMATQESVSSREKAQHPSSILFPNSSLPWTSSSSPSSTSSTPSPTLTTNIPASPSRSSTFGASSRIKTTLSEGPWSQTNIVVQSSLGDFGVQSESFGLLNTSMLPSYSTTKHISIIGTGSSSFLPSGSDKGFPVRTSVSLHASAGMIGSKSVNTRSRQNPSFVSSPHLSLGTPGAISATSSPKITNVGASIEPSGIRGSTVNGTRGWLGAQSEGSVYKSSKAKSAGTAVKNDELILPTMPLTTVGPEHIQNATTRGGNNRIALNTIGLPSVNVITAIPPNSTILNANSSEPIPINAGFGNSNLSDATFKNVTLHPVMSANPTLANATTNNATRISGFNSSFNNFTLHTLSMKNSTSSTNSSLSDTTLSSSAPTSIWYIQTGNVSIAVNFQPMYPTLRRHLSSGNSSATTTGRSVPCSGTVTKDIQKTTKTITVTILENETTTLYGNASTPLPELIPPPPACTTSYLPLGVGVHKPGVPDSTTSTLLVTKKSPVVIRAPQTVGPIYNIPTTSAQAVVEQGPESPNQAGAEGANDGAQVNSAGQVLVQENDKDPSPGSAPLRQVYPEEMPAALPKYGQPNLPQTDPESNEVHSSSNEVHQPGNIQGSVGGGQVAGGDQGSSGGNRAPDGGNAGINGENMPGSNVHKPGGQASGNRGATINGAQGSGGNGEISSDGGISGEGGHPSDGGKIPGNVHTPSGGQASSDGPHTSGQQQSSSGGGDSNSQVINGNQETKGEDQLLNGGQAIGSGDQGDRSTVGSTGNSLGSGQRVPGKPSPKGGVPGSAGSNIDGSSGSGGLSKSGPSVVDGVGPASPEGASQGSSGKGNSDTDQYVPEIAMIDNVPVSIGHSAIAVGSQSFSIGSPATTIIANGQPIVIGPSQIVASGTTVPIEVAISTPPTTSTIIGDVPVVLQPSDIMIGSQAFTHGSSAAFAVYNGQTYSWDAKQLVGPGGTMVSFPSATSAAPRITAGGQVFSVSSSTLKASGTDIAIPNSPQASSFVYRSQTFTVNPSQLIAADKSITVPPITQPTPFVYNDETFSVDSSRFIAPSATMPLSSGSGTVRYGTQVITVDQTHIICPSTTITLSNVPQTGTTATPSAITIGVHTFSLGPQAAVVGSTTYSFLPGQTPATITDHGQPVILGPSGIQLGGIFISAPTNPPIPPTYSAVTQGDLTFSVGPSAVVLGGQTHYIQPSMAPISTVISGQTISIGNRGVGLASTTIPLPIAPQGYATVTEGPLTISVAPSEAVVSGSTFAIGPNMPVTMSLDGQMVAIGPNEIHFPGTTVDLPTGTSQETPVAVTADGLTFSVGPTNAVIDGTSYAIGSGAIAKTIVAGSETIRLGTNGVVLPFKTVPPEQTPSAITAYGLTFSVDATEAIISGTTYAIGSEAIAKTIVVGSETIRLGTKGIVLPSTTIAPWGNATNTGLSSAFGTASTIHNSPAASVASAAPPPTGLPATEPQGTKNDVHQGTAPRLRPQDIYTIGAILSGLCLSLLGLI